MTVKTIEISEIIAQIPELVTLIVDGEEIIFTDQQKPIARITPITSSEERRIPGLHAGSAWTSDDFDEPLSDEFWTGNAALGAAV